MYFDYEKNKEHKFYDLALPLVKAYTFLRFDVECFGRENVPEKGPLILACNHISFSDPAVIVANINRRANFMAKSELFKNPALAFLLRQMNAFPVRRGYSDREALRYAMELLRQGRVLGIFPEGRRIRAAVPTTAKTGVAMIARHTGADVLPLCLYLDPGEDVIRPHIRLRFGEPLSAADLGFHAGNRKEEVSAAAELIMNKITQLWEKEHGNSRC